MLPCARWSFGSSKTCFGDYLGPLAQAFALRAFGAWSIRYSTFPRTFLFRGFLLSEFPRTEPRLDVSEPVGERRSSRARSICRQSRPVSASAPSNAYRRAANKLPASQLESAATKVIGRQ